MPTVGSRNVSNCQKLQHSFNLHERQRSEKETTQWSYCCWPTLLASSTTTQSNIIISIHRKDDVYEEVLCFSLLNPTIQKTQSTNPAITGSSKFSHSLINWLNLKQKKFCFLSASTVSFVSFTNIHTKNSSGTPRLKSEAQLIWEDRK